MKTNIKKIGICLLFAVFCLKGYGQIIVEENRHHVSLGVSPVDTYCFYGGDNSIYLRIGNNSSYTFGSFPVSFCFSENVYSFSPADQYYYFYTVCGDAGGEDGYTVRVPYWTNIADVCSRTTIYDIKTSLSISGPLYIDKIVFSNIEGNESIANEYACPDQYPYIRIIFKEIPENAPDGYYYPTVYIDKYYYPVVDIECRNDGGNWVTVSTTGGTSSHTIPYSSFLNKPGLNPHEKMFFRTVRALPDGSCGAATYTDKGFFFFPQFRFPAGTDVEVIPPACKGEPTTIKIPYEGNINYNFTIKGTSGEWANGRNFALGGVNGDKVSKTSTHFIITDNFPVGNNSLIVEYGYFDGESPCAFATVFTITEVPDFTISNPSYPNGVVDNYEITKNGGTASVQFNISNSYNKNITIKAGTLSFDRTLNNTPNPNGYYNGTITIDLPAGTYTNTIYATNAANCTSNKVSATLRQPDTITYTLDPLAPKCYNERGGVKISNIKGGIGARTYSLDSGNSQPFNVDPLELTNMFASSRNPLTLFSTRQSTLWS